MTLNIGNIVGNSKELDMARSVKTYLVDVIHVVPSPDNPYHCTPEDTHLLAVNIAENGLYTPLTVEHVGNDYFVISGHRRLAAIQELVNDGKRYCYGDADITGKVPVVVRATVVDHNQRILSMIAANNQRDMSSDEKRAVVDITLETLHSMADEGTWSKPVGMRIAEVIADLTGIKEHFIKDHLAARNRAVAEAENDGGETPPKAKKEGDEAKKMLKALKAANKAMLTSADSSYVAMDPEMKMQMTQEALLLYSKLDMLLKQL